MSHFGINYTIKKGWSAMSKINPDCSCSALFFRTFNIQPNLKP